MLVRQRRVPTTPLFGSHRMQFPGESLSVGPALHHEAALSASRKVTREAEEGKYLRSPVAARLPLFGGELSELDQARLVLVEPGHGRSR